MKTAQLLLGIVLSCTAAFVQARSSVPYVDHPNVPIMGAETKGYTLEQIKRTILAAGTKTSYPWDPVKDEPGMLHLTTIVRGKHTVVVEVRYDTKSFGIKYVSSVNMNERGDGLIHPNYNRWVDQLIQAINREFSRQ